MEQIWEQAGRLWRVSLTLDSSDEDYCEVAIRPCFDDATGVESVTPEVLRSLAATLPELAASARRALAEGPAMNRHMDGLAALYAMSRSGLIEQDGNGQWRRSRPRPETARIKQLPDGTPRRRSPNRPYGAPSVDSGFLVEVATAYRAIISAGLPRRQTLADYLEARLGKRPSESQVKRYERASRDLIDRDMRAEGRLPR